MESNDIRSDAEADAIHIAVDAAVERFDDFPTRFEGDHGQLRGLFGLRGELERLVREHPSHLEPWEENAAGAFVAELTSVVQALARNQDVADNTQLENALARGPLGLMERAVALEAQLTETRLLQARLERLQRQLRAFERQHRCLDHLDRIFDAKRAPP